MMRVKFLRWLGLAVVLSLALATVPALPVQAYNDITLNPTTGKVGDTITVYGSGWGSYTTERYANIFMAQDNLALNAILTTSANTYKRLGGEFIIRSDQDPTTAGTFTTTVTIPSALTDGPIDKDVTSGTYYFYITVTTQSADPNLVLSKATFSLVAGAMTVSPLQGKVDSYIDLIGTGFAPATAISVKFDGVVVPIEEGSTVTTSTGTFDSSILVPEEKAGSHTITVAVGTVEKTATYTITPDILITPQSGDDGAEVLVSGTGFGRRVEPRIFFNNFPVETTSPVLTDTKGTFSTSFLVPGEGLGAGVYQVEADDGVNTAAASFTLNVPPPTTPEPEPTTPPPPAVPELTLNATGDTIGANIGIGGSGFTPNAKVTIKYDDTEVDSAIADADGIVVAIFATPPSKHGDHTITVSDGTHTNSVTFTVESVAPKTPPPLSPEMGSKANSPVTFDWQDVTDESSPVTYELQIATDDTFSAASIVIDKTGIESSTYMLTEAEELKLAGSEDAYYWRIRAVDAASNESPWTGAGEFYVGAGGTFPSWALYTVLGIGAVLLFGIGYWLGRRTAFYY